MLPKPYNISASTYGNGIRLSWSIVPSFENGFSIERKLKSEDDKAFVVIDYLYAIIGEPYYSYTDLNINTYSTYTTHSTNVL